MPMISHMKIIYKPFSPNVKGFLVPLPPEPDDNPDDEDGIYRPEDED
jgi:hypothetical protein